MQYKKTILVLMTSCFGLSLVVLAIFCAFLFTGNISNRHCGILVPNEGGYVEAWTEHLPQMARKIGIAEVGLYTYNDYDEFIKFFSNSDKYNILFAEVPVTGEFDLKDIMKDSKVASLEKKIEEKFPYSLCRTIYEHCGMKDLKFMPLSYNPWIMAKLVEQKETTPFEISIGGYSDSGAYAFLQYVRLYSEQGKTLSKEEGIKKIQEMSNDRTLLRNSRSYTFRDAFIALENYTVKKSFMPMSFFNSLSISQRQSVKIEKIPSTMIADVTIALFPIRKNDESKKRVELARKYLLQPEINYSVANARGWLPALTTTISRSSYTEEISRQTRRVPYSEIPNLQYSRDEQDELLNKLDKVLRYTR